MQRVEVVGKPQLTNKGPISKTVEDKQVGLFGPHQNLLTVSPSESLIFKEFKIRLFLLVLVVGSLLEQQINCGHELVSELDSL